MPDIVQEWASRILSALQSTQWFLFWQRPIEIRVVCPSSHKFIQTQVSLTRVQLLLINSSAIVHDAVLLLLKEIPLISSLKGSWRFYPIGPLMSVKHNRFCKVQFLTLAPNTGWDHYTNMLFLCYLIKAAVSVCLLGLELGKSQSQRHSLRPRWQKHFAKDPVFSFSQAFSFLQLFPLLPENWIKILKLLFLQLISCDLTMDNGPVVSPSHNTADDAESKNKCHQVFEAEYIC